MNGTLDGIFDAYKNAMHAMAVVRRCVERPGVDRRLAFGKTRYYGLARVEVEVMLAASESEMDDLIVLSLYAAFERRVRDHVASQSYLLRGATIPSEVFGEELEKWFLGQYQRMRMEEVLSFYAPPVSRDLVADVGNVRAFRHWVAHGRNPNANKTSIDPAFAYRVLRQFLHEAGLT